MKALALAAIGRDRPGIVAAVSRVLFDLGCNVEDSSMTLLRGNFSMMLVVAAPDPLDTSSVDDALRPVCQRMGLVFLVLPVDDRATVPQPTHIVTVYGADRAGILLRTSEVLASAGANITDLNSRLVGDESSPVYALMLELEVPPSADVEGLEQSLRDVGAEIGVDVVLHERETDVL